MIKLSKKREKWVGTRTTALLGKPLEYNAAEQKRYEKALRDLVKRMTDEVTEKLIILFKDDAAREFHAHQKQMAAMDASIASQAKILMRELMRKFGKLFRDKAPLLAERMVRESSKTSTRTLHASLKELTGGLSLKTSIVPKGMKEVAKAVVFENVQLIKSIPQEYLHDVYGSVMRSITTGGGLADLLPALRKYTGVSDRRVKNLALDQTRKAYNGINKQRMLATGVTKFKWLHSAGGQQPRQHHIAMSGNIYSFDDLPIIEPKTGERGIPGQAINCRCRMVPVIELDNGEEV